MMYRRDLVQKHANGKWRPSRCSQRWRAKAMIKPVLWRTGCSSRCPNTTTRFRAYSRTQLTGSRGRQPTSIGVSAERRWRYLGRPRRLQHGPQPERIAGPADLGEGALVRRKPSCVPCRECLRRSHSGHVPCKVAGKMPDVDSQRSESAGASSFTPAADFACPKISRMPCSGTRRPGRSTRA
jgi:hypothetical protein